ncbi:hypothetical protein [Macrococcoides caseolyticum]|uniref:hypothetical protein n=1 Tax=Macrococcoides caseolyticum TaxID=69966 RepID=UPI001F2E880A|nr:hypothetical protein [Macrococcus caseolyticus]MCE4957327.1 hypothetical protein [Macrococcus caseolyticus]
MFKLFKKRKEQPVVDESKIDLNVRKELEKTFIKKHMMNERAVNAIVEIFRKYPQEIILVTSFSDPPHNKENFIIKVEDIINLSFVQQIEYIDSLLLIYDCDYQPLIYWKIISGDLYIHPKFKDIEIIEDKFELTENYMWEAFDVDAKELIYFVDTKIRGYKTISWSASWNSLEFFDLIETFNITGAILNEGYEETNEILKQYKVEYEKYNGFLLINGNIDPKFLMKYYNINGNQGTICEMALFVDMEVPVTKDMIKGKYVDISEHKTILPIDDYSDILCFFNF